MGQFLDRRYEQLNVNYKFTGVFWISLRFFLLSTPPIFPVKNLSGLLSIQRGSDLRLKYK